MDAIIFEKENGGISTISFLNGIVDITKVPNSASYKIVDAEVINAALTQPIENYIYDESSPVGAVLNPNL